MPYRWKQEGNVLRVLDVEVMSRLNSKTHSNPLLKKIPVDTKFLNDLVTNFNSRAQRGKTADLLLRHNTDKLPAQVIGKLANMRFDGTWIRADLLVTDPEQQERMKRGELPNRSAEFYLGRRVLWGLSLIDGEEGHFGDFFPDLILKDTVGEIVSAPENLEVVALEKTLESDDLMCALSTKPLKLEKSPMPKDKKAAEKTDLKLKAFHSSVKLQNGSVEVQPTPEAEVVTVSEQPTAEEVAAITDAAVDPIDSRLSALEAQIAEILERMGPATEEPAEGGDAAALQDGDDDDEDHKETMRKAKEDLKTISEEAGRVRLSKLADDVIDSGSVLSRDQIIEKLSECKTDEGRAERAEALKLSSKKDGPAVTDDSSPVVTKSYKENLEEAYEKSPHKKQGLSLEQYEEWADKRGYTAAFRA